MKRLAVVALLVFVAGSGAAEPLSIGVGVLRRPHMRETLSILDIPAEDDAIAGARLGAADNNTTGKFTNQAFDVVDETFDGDATASLARLRARNIKFIIADLPPEALIAAADAARDEDVLLFNISAPDERLRETDCRANIIHIAPSRAMLADALAQYLVWKKWSRWLLVRGAHPEDDLLAQAYRRAAKKFGAKIVEERVYDDPGAGRRSDSGHTQTQREMPTLTQSAPTYDVLLAVDENNVFAGYLPYRTWDPRPVAGSAGLYPTSWDPGHEQWGAHQLQNRFMQLNRRPMNARDNAAWLAMRMIGEATTRTGSASPDKIRAFMAGGDFSMAAFKGVRLSLRAWNQQLRQPILLSDGRMTVSVSPQEGFLHQKTELDTLGLDQPETGCSLK